MSDEKQSELKPDEIEAIHEVAIGMEVLLDGLYQKHPEAIGNALLSCAVLLVGKIYAGCPSMEDAQQMLEYANNAGLDNWVKEQEAVREAADAPKLIVPH